MIGKLLNVVFYPLLLLHCLCFIVNNVSATADSLKQLESLDERNDALIFRSVVQSMSEWEEKRARHGHHRAKREVSRVCYEDVGCFEDTGPFSYLEMLPSPPKDVGTRFFVYGSRKARSIPMEVPAEEISSMTSSNAIDPELPTKILVHGFGSSCDQVWVYEIRAALRSIMECNIVCVDWGPGSAVPNYVRAAANARLVGRQLAKLVRSLDVPMGKVHLIGFSLGAHVAGFAGAELGNVSRITGLDPAGPLFEAQDPRARLDETDAQFVDVIHSNGEQLILGGLGSWQPMGDVDFYPNGGRMQTGCSNIFVGAVSDIIWSNPVEGRSLCNHRRAYKLFTDSVSPKCRFPAFPCEKGYDGLLKGECFPCGTHPDNPCGDMGFYSDRSQARGQLYLLTRDEEPFCAHQYQIKLYNSKHERPVKSYGKLQVTLLAEGSMNETFTMTKKDDEELLVGKTLQKIVVPHPALANLDAIEIKYTAYSGWISSGLVSWSVDKVSITDSYGAIHSVCRRGLVLESGKSIYLPLYRGDCSVPPEQDDQDDSGSNSTKQEITVREENKKGIGPFTKEQNYDRSGGKDGFTNDVPQKGLGPFTKEQNIKIANDQAKLAAAKKEFSEKFVKAHSSASSVWSLAELSNDGGSNSVENNNIGEFAERGRGFSGVTLTRPVTIDRAALAAASSSSSSSSSVESSSSAATTEVEVGSKNGPSVGKKESARSLRLPEITEPVLRPRGTRNDNAKSITMEDRKHELMEESPTSNRGFTVQFLPERLAGILAQAERYARQTLLPLISQYTPSFMGGGRSDRPKYFPPLGNLFGLKSDNETGKKLGDSNDSRTKYYIEFDEPTSTTTTTTARTKSEAFSTSTPSSVAKSKIKSDWVPLTDKSLQSELSRKEKSIDADVAGEWLNEGGSSWSPKANESESVVTETKIDDWVPLIPVDSNKNNNSSSFESEQKKFIPLLDFASKDESTTTTITTTTTTTRESDENKVAQARSIVFPYVYERKNDPRTRYIPLIPEEDLGLGVANNDDKESKR